MKKRNRTKAFVAFFLVMATLFALASFVSAEFSEYFLDGEYIDGEYVESSSDGIPEQAKTALRTINEGNGWLYIHHTYENTTNPPLPSNTTYTTYRFDNSLPIIIDLG